MATFSFSILHRFTQQQRPHFTSGCMLGSYTVGEVLGSTHLPTRLYNTIAMLSSKTLSYYKGVIQLYLSLNNPKRTIDSEMLIHFCNQNIKFPNSCGWTRLYFWCLISTEKIPDWIPQCPQP